MFKVKVENFQSIESTEVEVSGFTTITGKSNIGKTALLRAVSGSIFNKAVGSYARDPKKPVVVSVKGEGIDYIWRKNEKGINQYIIEEKVYDKCGNDSLLEISPEWFKSLKIGDRETFPWYASQFNPLFLIDESSAKVSEFFAEFCRIGTISRAVKLAGQKKREAEMLANHLEEEVERLKKSIFKFDGLNEFKSIIKDLEEQKISIETLESAIHNRSRYGTEINACRKLLGNLGVVARTNVPDHAPMRTQASKYTGLKTLASKHEICVYEYHSMSAITEAELPEPPEMPALVLLEKASKLQKLVKNKVVPQIPVGPATDQYKHVYELQSKLDKLYDSYFHLSKELKRVKHEEPEKEYFQYKILLEREKLKRAQNQIRTLSGEISVLEDEIRKIPTCPSCERPLDRTHDTHP